MEFKSPVSQFSCLIGDCFPCNFTKMQQEPRWLAPLLCTVLNAVKAAVTFPSQSLERTVICKNMWPPVGMIGFTRIYIIILSILGLSDTFA